MGAGFNPGAVHRSFIQPVQESRDKKAITIKCTIMKKMFTLSIGFLSAIAAFAGYAPSSLTVMSELNSNIKVTVDGNRFDQQMIGNSVVFNNIQPGFHIVKVFQQERSRGGWFGRRRDDDFRLVYTATVNIKPLFATSIELNRFGRAQISEQPMRNRYDERGWDGDKRFDNGRDDHRDWDRDHRDNGYSNSGYGYNRVLSNQDFFAAQRVMDRESFDNARLLYAKRLADDCYFTSEQVKDLAKFFSFDNSRMEFVKYAYAKTVDKNNFSIVCNAFDSNYAKDQLMNFIRSCR